MTPNTTITLYATDFDITNKHVVYAPNEGAAFAAVSSFPSITFTNCYWQRTDGFVFRCNGNINEIEKYNYCIFTNNGKRNYAFITKYQYVNDAMTWVYLEIDPWLNYAGQYDFHDSPMVRCHPESDGVNDANYNPEPTIDYHVVYTTYTGGESSEDDDSIYLLTSVSSLSFADSDVNDYWEGLLTLFQQSSVDLLKTWSAKLQPKQTSVAGAYSQACTSWVFPAQGGRIVRDFIQNGQGNSILGAYHVPKFFDISAAGGADIVTMPKSTRTVTIPTDSGITTNWNKLKYAPQYHELIVNVTGNTRKIPIDVFPTGQLIGGATLTFNIVTDPGVNGCATVYPSGMIAGAGNGNFSVQSMPWDRVQLIGQGVDKNAMQSAMLGEMGGLLSTAFSIAGQVGSLNLLGAVETTVSGTLAEGEKKLEQERLVRDSVTTFGTPSNSISSYNMAAPLVQISYSSPDATGVRNIEKIFGTYGYMQGGTIQPIIFNNYPFWNYYQTIEASITGRGVPQKYLAQVIGMFNRGVFVFNDVANYKDFSNAQGNHL